MIPVVRCRDVVLLGALLSSVVACGDDDAPPMDSGSLDSSDVSDSSSGDGGDAGADFIVASPVAPAVPTFAPCADGWVEATDGEVTLCLPWAGGEPAACTGATFQPPGAATCVSVGTPCPTGDFPDDVPATGVVYVLAGAAAGGDGSRGMPFASLSEASGAVAGQTVLLSRGTHTGRFSVPGGVTLRGACTAETTLTDGDGTGVFLVAGGTASVISDLTILDVGSTAITAHSGGEVTVERVVIERASQTALRARTGSTMHARDVVVRDTVGRVSSGLNGLAFLVQDASTASATRAVFEDSRQGGVVAAGEGTSVTLDQVAVIRNEGQDADGAGGVGLQVQEGAHLEAIRTAVVEARLLGMLSTGAGADASCDQCFIAGTRVDRSLDGRGEGAAAFSGATVTLRRTVVEDNVSRGLWAYEEGSTVTVEDSVVRDTVAEAGGEQGRGVHASNGGNVVLRRVAILRSIGHALSATSASTIDAQDVLVDGVVPRELDGEFGRAISAVDGSSVTVTRAVVREHSDIAVMVSTDAHFTGTDLAVLPGMGTRLGDGQVIQAQLGATVTLSRVAARGFRNTALVCLENSTCTVSDGSFTEGDRSALDDVRGIIVFGTSTFEGDRIELSGLTAFGAYASTGAVANYRGLRIGDVTTCEARCSYPGGTALAVFAGGTVTVADFAFRDVTLCGVHIGEEGVLDLSRGEISGAAIGACLESDGQDLTRLMDEVRFVDNGTNLDVTSLPVPDAPPVVGLGRD